MKKTGFIRGERFRDILLEINGSLLNTKLQLEKEIIDSSPLSALKQTWLDSLNRCLEKLDKCVRVLVLLNAPKNLEKSDSLELEIEKKLRAIMKYSTEYMRYYSVISEMIEPEVDDIYALMNEYVTL
ncbi:MAG: hypothetical protein IJY01_07695 [Clostridia bacterium]|nr:hypothetical protein [Clostridia bacterium]MBQ8290735.1 hypothetical protein [Clostridia bacterium]